jgi:hypothetical protein
MSVSFNLGAEPTIKIETVEGDLRLVGWDNEEILVKISDEENLVSTQEDPDGLVLSCPDDLSLNVPRNASVTILRAMGDVSIRGLAGSLNMELADGDVAMRDVGQVTIGTIESDFSLRGANGDVHVKHVGRDASLRSVDGGIKLDSVSDDLAIRGVGGNLNVDVDDDVVVHLEPRPGQEYSVVAGDDIMLVLPPDANATLNINADEIKVKFLEVNVDDSTSQVITLGDGAASINLNAGSRVLVSETELAADSAFEFSNFAGMLFGLGNVGKEFGESWGNWGKDFGEYWGNWGQEFGERVSHKAVEAAERAARKAEATARRMERHARHQERHARKAARKNAKLSWTFDTSKFTPPPKPSEPVSDEERMSILQMLSDKKITAEQAEELLAALEGGK